MTQTELEKQILEILNRNYMFLKEYDKSAAKEIASLMWQKPDINTLFFGNSGVKILVTKQNSYPKEFLEWIDSSMKNGVTLRKVYDYWKTNVRDK